MRSTTTAQGAANSLQAPDTVETGRVHRRRGKRGRGTVAKIQKTARERQEAWRTGAEPGVTRSLTRDLDQLFDDRRDEQVGTFTNPYFGRTSAAGRA